MSLRNEAVSGLVWTYAKQFGEQIISFIVSLVLARLLLPEEFGLIGMIAIFVAVGRVLIDSGLTQSLIRGKDLDQRDFSTIFYFNLVASILAYFLVYSAAPLVAEFYGQKILSPILRLYCIVFIINAFAAVQLARLTQKLDFKTQTVVAIPSIIIGGLVGVVLAFKGFGVWSLVWYEIIKTIVSTIQLWLYSGWVPSLVFSKSKFTEHFNFGYKLTLSALLDKIFSNMYLIVIGKYFSAGQVGLYTRAETMKNLPVRNISSALNQVTYPLFSTIQDDDKRLKKIYRQLMQAVVYILAPVLVLMAVLAEPIFRFLFTEKWLPAVPFFQILCITGILYPVHAYNLNVLKVKGRSDLFLKLAIIKKSITVVAILVGIQFGIFGLLYAQALASVISFGVNAYYTDRFINYSAWEQTKDISPIIITSLLVGAMVWVVDLELRDQIDIIRLAFGGGVGISIYYFITYIFKFESLFNIQKIIFRK